MRPSRPTPARGFTLLELMIVVLLLAALAASAVSLVDDVDLQARHDLTQSRRQQVRRAILGDPSRTVNGQPLISGFVADMGRLPTSLRELVQPIDENGDPLARWDIVDGVGRGWRGPYVEPQLEVRDVDPDPGVEELAHVPAFRDGWGNRDADPADDALRFGWRFEPDYDGDADGVDGLDLGSHGRDGAALATSDPYELDLPSLAVAPPHDALMLVRPDEWQVDLAGTEVRIDFSGGAPAVDPVRLVVLTPTDDAGAWSALHLSDPVSVDDAEEAFPFPSSPPEPDRGLVPAGTRVVALVADTVAPADTVTAADFVGRAWVYQVLADSTPFTQPLVWSDAP